MAGPGHLLAVPPCCPLRLESVSEPHKAARTRLATTLALSWVTPVLTHSCTVILRAHLSFLVKDAQLCPSLCNPMDSSPWNSPGQNTGVGSLPILQGIFPTQGSNPGLLHRRQIISQLSHQGIPVFSNHALNSVRDGWSFPAAGGCRLRENLAPPRPSGLSSEWTSGWLRWAHLLPVLG